MHLEDSTLGVTSPVAVGMWRRCACARACACACACACVCACARARARAWACVWACACVCACAYACAWACLQDQICFAKPWPFGCLSHIHPLSKAQADLYRAKSLRLPGPWKPRPGSQSCPTNPNDTEGREGWRDGEGRGAEAGSLPEKYGGRR